MAAVARTGFVRLWVLLLLVLIAVGIALAAWCAQRQGWTRAMQEAWVQWRAKPPSGSPAAPGGHAGHATAGGASGGESMPGMGPESTVPGHAAVMVPGEVQQRIGVTIGRVERGPLLMSVRTVGILRPNETTLARVNVRTSGWVEKLLVNYTGQRVRQGDPLLAIYSPDFLSTQQEYLTARREGGQGVRPLAAAALRRLQLWGVPQDAIARLEKTGQVEQDLLLRSPIAGTVLEKNVLEGEYVTPEKQLYMIADLSTVWVEAKAYEYELPHVELGQPADVNIPSLPGRTLTGKVVFVQPVVEEPSRTVQVRIELPNREGTLKPGMFAHVQITHHMGQGLLVPTSAVMRTGQQDIAYRVQSPGVFMPVVVEISPYGFGDRFQVLKGLQAGEQIATSALFLIDSESRLRVSGGGMAGMPGMGNMGGMEMGGEKTGQAGSPGSPPKPPKPAEPDQGMKGMDHSRMQH